MTPAEALHCLDEHIEQAMRTSRTNLIALDIDIDDQDAILAEMESAIAIRRAEAVKWLKGLHP